MQKVKVKRVIELLQECNQDAEFEIVIDGQVVAQEIFISWAYKNSEDSKRKSVAMEPKNCDVVTFNIKIE